MPPASQSTSQPGAADNPIANPHAVASVWPIIQPPPEAYALALQAQFDQTQWWYRQRIEAQQLLQIQQMIRHAARTVPFHAARLAAVADLDVGELTLDRLRELPIMTRADIQDNAADLITRNLPSSHGQMSVIRSSGSTGRPIEMRGTQLTRVVLMALTLRGHRWHRRDLMQKNIDIRTALPAGATAPTRWAAVVATGPTIRLDIAQPLAQLLDSVIEEDPAYLQTHPSTIKGMVEISAETGRRPRSLREVRTFGEALAPDLRDYVHAQWGVPLVDNYSANEIGTIAHQCPRTTNLHVQAENVLVEILRTDGTPCAPGETGRVVLTALHNFATPIIRYEIGDHARVGEPCPCGRGLPVLEQILGRDRNLLVYPNGDRLFPEPRVGLVETVAPLRQFQLRQPEVDRLVFNIVPARPWSANDEAVLRNFLQQKFRHPFTIDIVYVDDIPRTANGKFEEFHSEVS